MTLAREIKREKCQYLLHFWYFQFKMQQKVCLEKTSRQRDRTNLPSVTFKVDHSIFPSRLSHMATAPGFPSCMRGRVSLNSCQSHPSHRQEPSSNAWKLPPRASSEPSLTGTTALISIAAAWCHFLSFLVPSKILSGGWLIPGGHLWREALLLEAWQNRCTAGFFFVWGFKW